MDRTVRTVEDVLALLDGLFASGSEAGSLATGDGRDFWGRFYADRSRPVPFFVSKPDENLASYLDKGLIAPGRALDLGCGPGRNALYLAAHGFEVDAVDLSPVAVSWGEDRAREAGVGVRFLCGDAFAFPAGEGGMGSELTDADLYRQRELQGGLAYTPESLRRIFSDLAQVELRRMREEPPESALFGVPFLWTALFRRGAAASGDARTVQDRV